MKVKDYSNIIGQLDSLDTDFAQQLNTTVVENIEENPAKALENANILCEQLDDTPLPWDYRETYAR